MHKTFPRGRHGAASSQPPLPRPARPLCFLCFAPPRSVVLFARSPVVSLVSIPTLPALALALLGGDAFCGVSRPQTRVALAQPAMSAAGAPAPAAAARKRKSHPAVAPPAEIIAIDSSSSAEEEEEGAPAAHNNGMLHAAALEREARQHAAAAPAAAAASASTSRTRAAPIASSAAAAASFSVAASSSSASPAAASPASVAAAAAAPARRSRVSAAAPAAVLASAPDTSLLPHSYQFLLELFPKVYTHAALIWSAAGSEAPSHGEMASGAPACTFDSMRSNRDIGGRFTFHHLRQMVTLAPSMLTLRPIILPKTGGREADPFAPAQRMEDVRTLPLLQAQYELLSTPLLARAAANHARHEGSQSSALPARYTGGGRNSVSRPRGPKPTPQRLAQAVVEFKQCVVNYFAHPDASINIPPCELPPHEDPADAEAAADDDADGPSQAHLSVPRYSKLIDRLTVSIADNSDPATRPRCAESYQQLSAPPAGLAALLGLPAPAAAAAAPADDAKMEDSADSASRVKQEAGSSAAAAAASSSSSAAATSSAAASVPAAAPSVPVSSKLDPALLSSIDSPLFHNLLAHLRQQKFYQNQIEFVKHIPARAAITVEIKPRPFVAAQGLAPAAAVAAASSSAAASASAAAAAPAAAAVDRAADLLGLAPAADSPVFLSPRIVRALGCLSPPIRSLFLHQSQAITALHEGAPVVVVATATSSGKSLCYTLPILEALTADPQARALCLFPTKALAQDQLRSLREFIHAVGGVAIGVDTYDGDTAQALRASVRDSARVLLTNPDMLHLSMLPLHPSFATLWRNLKFIVLDESHVYHSQFGAHVALVLRRLRRVCAFYGSRPQFVCTSATMSSPSEMIAALLGVPPEDVRVVTEDGSARGEKNFLVWNPPKAEPKPGDAAAAGVGSANPGHNARAFEFAPFLASDTRRRSAHMESALLLANLVQINYKTICFTGSRKVAEIISKWTCETLSQTRSTRDLIPLVRSYRGGYSASDRRAIESALFSGQLRGVVSTNALELGIDIGTLDATIHVGVPKSVASLWQQSGRSGRGVRDSLSILVAFDSPLDQYYCAHPHQLFERAVEKCVIDMENPELLRAHVMCAAVELPLSASRDLPYFGPAFLPILHTLIHDKFWLAQRARDPRIASPFDAWAPCYELVNGTWEREFAAQQAALAGCNSSTTTPARGCGSSDVGPAAYFSLRAPSGLVFSIQDSQSGRELDTTEHRRAMFDLHVGAVFNHQGAEYLVQSWDHTKGVIKVKPLSKAGADFYTRCIDHKWITIMSRIRTFPASAAEDAARGPAQQPVEETMPTSLARHLLGLRDSISNSSAAASSRTFDPEWSVLPRDVDGGSWYLKSEADGASRGPLTWRSLCAYGRAKVSTSVYGFRRFSKRSGKVVDKEDLSMPLHHFDTWAAWVDIPASIRHAYAQWEEGQLGQGVAPGHAEPEEERKASDVVVQPAGKRVKRESQVAASSASAGLTASSSSSAAAAAAVSSSPVSWSPDGLLSIADRNRMQQHAIHAALHGLSHCVIALLPMFLLCDGPTDLRCDCPSVYELNYEQRESRPHRLLLYESQSSVGSAFVRATSQVLHLVLQRARALIESCPCTGLRGCPSCVQSSRCSELNEVTYKAGALWLAKALEQWSQEEPLPE